MVHRRPPLRPRQRPLRARASRTYLASRLGVEPLSAEFTAEELARVSAGRQAPLKSFLLDQTRVAGIGNIYADEALYRAELHPLSPAGSMRAEHREALVEGIVEALEAGLANGGSSIDDYRDARGERGSMQDEFLVHTREGQDCPRCGGTIRRIVVGGRSTYFCPDCQVRLRKRRRSAAGEGERDERFDRATAARGLSYRALDRRERADRLHGRDRAGGRPRRRRRARRRAGHAGDRRDRPARGTDGVSAVVLAGGSAYGLAAADGAMRWLEEHGIGYPTPAGLVPIVPAAIVYDLAAGDPSARPDPEAGYAACEAAARGRAASGARSAPEPAPRSARSLAARARRPAGIGYAAARGGFGATVAALAVANAFGDVIGGGRRRSWVAPRARRCEVGDAIAALDADARPRRSSRSATRRSSA